LFFVFIHPIGEARLRRKRASVKSGAGSLVIGITCVTASPSETLSDA
jgi:hypothetical protein